MGMGRLNRPSIFAYGEPSCAGLWNGKQVTAVMFYIAGAYDAGKMIAGTSLALKMLYCPSHALACTSANTMASP